MTETTIEKITRTSSRLIDDVGQSLTWLTLSLVKLSLVGLFFCYLVEFVRELWAGTCLPDRGLAVLLAVIVMLCLVFIVVRLFSGMRAEWNAAAQTPEKGSVRPFVTLILFPIIIVAIANHWFSHTFTSPLLKETQDRINQFWTWI